MLYRLDWDSHQLNRKPRMLIPLMACRYALYVGSDYKDWKSAQIIFTRSFITSSVQLFYFFISLLTLAH